MRVAVDLLGVKTISRSYFLTLAAAAALAALASVFFLDSASFLLFFCDAFLLVAFGDLSPMVSKTSAPTAYVLCPGAVVSIGQLPKRKGT